MEKKLNANIWKMTVLFVTNKRPYMTFLTIFLLTMPSATAKTIGLLTLVGQITGFLFEIPSGYISDKLGHKNALVISRAALVLSTSCYVFANNVYWFFAGAILLAIGIAFMSGTSDAFIQETLIALKKEERYSEITGKMKSVGFAIPILLILALPVIAETNFQLAFGVMLIVDIIGMIAAMSLVKPPVEEKPIEEVDTQNFFSIIKSFFKMKWVKYVLASTLTSGIAFGVTAGFKNPYQEILGFSLTMLGVLWAASRVFVSLLLLLNGKIHKLFTFKQFILAKVAVHVVAFILIGFTSNKWIVALLFLIPTIITWGLGAAQAQYYLDFIGKSNSKATLLSIKTFSFNIFAGISGLLMGFLVAAKFYPFAYLIAGIVLFALMIWTAFFLKEKPRMVQNTSF